MSAPGPPRLAANVYYARKVATAKQCFICHKETTTCLATEDISDFVYACQSHLSDPGFARPIQQATAQVGVPQSEIDKFKQEYEERQRRKKEAEAEKKKTDESERAKESKG